MFLSVEEVREGLDFPDLEDQTQEVIRKVDLFLDEYTEFAADDRSFNSIMEKVFKMKKEAEEGSKGSIGLASSAADPNAPTQVSGMLVENSTYK
jgi:hypothetical protein